MDREVVNIHTMNSIHGRGPVFYASLTRELFAKVPKSPLPPCGGGLGWGVNCHEIDRQPHPPPNPLPSREGENTFASGSTDRESCKAFLVSTLWDHLAAMESPLWKGCQSSPGTAFPIQLLRGTLGRPHLLLGECLGPAISFSEGGGKVWAALSEDASAIGIDVAGADEFPGEYPSPRVFHPEELEHALSLADGDMGRASALLWSVKEAFVKALGCAFHLVDPLQITVYPSANVAAGVDEGYAFPVGLSGKALMLFPMATDRTLWVRSFPRREMWLSIAILNRSPTGHE